MLGSVADWTDSYSEDSSVLPDQSLTSSEIRLPCEHVGPGKRLTALFGGSFVGKKEAIQRFNVAITKSRTAMP